MVNFLDTTVYVQDSKLYTTLYTKPTDSHNYLHYSSMHPRKCKDSIPYSQFLRVRRICSTLEDYDKHAKEFYGFFRTRGYPSQLLEEALILARRQDRKDLLTFKTNPTESEAPVVLVTTYHPTEKTIVQVTKKNWNMLGKSQTTAPLHQKKFLVGYRRPKNLKDMLVRSTLKPIKQTPAKPSQILFPAQKQGTKQTDIRHFFTKESSRPLTHSASTTDISRGTQAGTLKPSSLTNLHSKSKEKRKCNNPKCRYCPRLNTTGTITCHVTNAKYYTMTNINCQSTNLVYAISCRTCGKQYVGQTKRSIMQRFQGHFDKVKRAVPNDAVGSHFSQTNHRGVLDMNISVLTFITPHPDSKKGLETRLKYEKSWIHRLRCPAPLGLNIFD